MLKTTWMQEVRGKQSLYATVPIWRTNKGSSSVEGVYAMVVT